MPTFDSSLVSFLFPAALLLLLLFILREVFAWYFKVNKVLRLLEKIEENTRRESPRPVREHEDKPAPRLFANYQDQGVHKKGFFG